MVDCLFVRPFYKNQVKSFTFNISTNNNNSETNYVFCVGKFWNSSHIRVNSYKIYNSNTTFTADDSNWSSLDGDYIFPIIVNWYGQSKNTTFKINTFNVTFK